MLDLARLKAIKLHKKPLGQRLVGHVLTLDYLLPRKTEIVLEGTENIPAKGGVFLAMNHTDRYNYWPLQYKMWKDGLPFTATWVKGKYYENPMIGAFMDSMNNIPLPSRGYVISTDFRNVVERAPSDDEYRLLRDLVDGKRAATEPLPEIASPDLSKYLLSGGAATTETFLERFDTLFSSMIAQVVELNRRAIEELDLSVLVFPEGTRSIRLSKGHNGLAQMAQHLGAPIIPVGCNGSDRLYPKNSPFSKGGRVVYRIGKPLHVDGPELGAHRVPKTALPFTQEATRQHGDQYTAITSVVMERIRDLLDAEHLPTDAEAGGGAQGMQRFL